MPAAASKIKSFKDLRVWRLGVEIVKEVYRLAVAFPKEELFGLTSQIKRAAVSIPSNIAEGTSRQHKTENRQFLYVAIGSAAELESHLVLAVEVGLISAIECQDLNRKLEMLKAMLLALARKMN